MEAKPMPAAGDTFSVESHKLYVNSMSTLCQLYMLNLNPRHGLELT